MIEITKYNVNADNSGLYELSGDNQKGIAIVYPSYTTVSEIRLLDTIITKATGSDSMKDVLKIALKSGSKLNWFQIMNNYKITNVLCFGINPRTLSLNFEYRYNELIKFQNIEYIFSNNLNEIVEDQELKKTLWLCLKSSSLT